MPFASVVEMEADLVFVAGKKSHIVEIDTIGFVVFLQEKEILAGIEFGESGIFIRIIFFRCHWQTFALWKLVFAVDIPYFSHHIQALFFGNRGENKVKKTERKIIPDGFYVGFITNADNKRRFLDGVQQFGETGFHKKNGWFLVVQQFNGLQIMTHGSDDFNGVKI